MAAGSSSDKTVANPNGGITIDDIVSDNLRRSAHVDVSVRPFTREEVARDLSVRPLTLENVASGRISFTDTTPRRIDGGEDPATLYVTAETDGDGACPSHAAFGIPDCISRQLTRPNARDTAADVLNTVFLLYVNHQSMRETVKHYFELVVSSVWEEFVRTVALGYGLRAAFRVRRSQACRHQLRSKRDLASSSTRAPGHRYCTCATRARRK